MTLAAAVPADAALITGSTVSWDHAENHRIEFRGSNVRNACGGDLSRLVRVIKLTGFVNSTADFTDQPKVANGASDLMEAVFGDAGKHARSAVGVPVLPLDSTVEIDAIVAVKPA